MLRRLVVASLAALGASGPAAHAAEPRQPEQWGLHAIGAPTAHGAGHVGAGVRVAVLDSGADATHPDLAGRLAAGVDLVGGGAPADTSAGGTHVSGIVAAGLNGTGIAGVAPEATVIAIRVLDASGAGETATVSEGVRQAVARGARVLHLSLGAAASALGGETPDPAVQAALDAGAVVVAAAGSAAAPVCRAAFAADPRLLCVGAYDRPLGGVDAAASFSASGAQVDLMAPGGDTRGILSTVPGGGHGERHGTSQAAAHVTGVAALLAAKGLSGTQIAERIVATAIPDALAGGRRLDAAAALDGYPADREPVPATPAPPPPPAPSPAGPAAPAPVSPSGPPATGEAFGPDPAPWGTVETTRVLRRRTVARRGIRVVLTGHRAGRVRIAGTVGGRRVAGVTRRVRAARRTVVVAPLTRLGRAYVARGRNFVVSLAVRLPGESDPHVKAVRVRG